MVRKLPSFSAALLLVAKCKGHLWGETKSPCGGLRRATATRRRHNFLGLFITKVNEFQDFYDALGDRSRRAVQNLFHVNGSFGNVDSPAERQQLSSNSAGQRARRTNAETPRRMFWIGYDIVVVIVPSFASFRGARSDNDGEELREAEPACQLEQLLRR